MSDLLQQISGEQIQDRSIPGGKIAAKGVSAAEIADLTITNGQISGTAAIAASKINTTGATNLVSKIIGANGIAVSNSGVGDTTVTPTYATTIQPLSGTTGSAGLANTIARGDHIHRLPTLAELGAAASSHNHDDRYFTETELGSTTLSSGAKLIGVNSISGLTGGNVQDVLASLKAYVDTTKAGLDPKDSVKVATTANISLSGLITIDGVQLADGDRVLVKDQTDSRQNGIYIAKATAWTRSWDADADAEVTPGMYVLIDRGTTQGGQGWTLQAPLDGSALIVGSSNLTFAKYSGAGRIQAEHGLYKNNDYLGISDGGVTDAKIGNRTATPAVPPTNNGPFGLNTWINYFTNRIVAITGESHWYITPDKTLKDKLSLSGGTIDGNLKITGTLDVDQTINFGPGNAEGVLGYDINLTEVQLKAISLNDNVNIMTTGTGKLTANGNTVWHAGNSHKSTHATGQPDAIDPNTIDAVKKSGDSQIGNLGFGRLSGGNYHANVVISTDDQLIKFIGRAGATDKTQIVASAVNGNLYFDSVGAIYFRNGIGGTNAIYVDTTGDLYLKQDPTQKLHSATKQYVDRRADAHPAKAVVRVASTSNIAVMGGLLEIDGVQLVDGDRILVKDQTNKGENGIFLARVLDWERSEDNKELDELTWGSIIWVAEGAVNKNTLWRLTTKGQINPRVTPLTFERMVNAEPGDGLKRNSTSGRLELAFNSAAPADLGTTASAGTSTVPARADHVHKLPTSASDFGAIENKNGTIPFIQEGADNAKPDGATVAVGGIYITTDTNKIYRNHGGTTKWVAVGGVSGITEVPIATATVVGGILSGGDITISGAGVVSVNDNSHGHTIANVSGLQNALDGKAPTHDHPYAPIVHNHAMSDITGLAIALSGKVDSVNNSVPGFEAGADTNKGDGKSVTGRVYIATDSKKMYRSNGNGWDPIGAYTHPTDDGNLHVPANGTANYRKVLRAGATAGSIGWSSASDYYEAAASEASLTGAKKADLLCIGEQCIYANTSTTGDIALAETIFDTLRFGNYSLMVRIKSANSSIMTDAIKVDVQKNVNGTYTSIIAKNIKPVMFANTTDYQCFYFNFAYAGAKATDNKLRVVISLLKTTAAFEVDLDYIMVMPVVVGAYALS